MSPSDSQIPQQLAADPLEEEEDTHVLQIEQLAVVSSHTSDYHSHLHEMAAADPPAAHVGFIFSGKRGTLTLSEFIGMYNGKMRETRLRFPTTFSQRTALELLSPYLRDGPLKLYNRNLEQMLQLTEVVPPRPAIIGVAERLEQYAREAVPALYDAADNMIRTARPAVPYLPYVAPIAPREALPAREELMADPLTYFFNMLREQYRFQNPDQVNELMDFTQQPGETAMQMKSRMENLLEALPDLMTDNEAAQKYLSQFGYHDKRRIQQQLISRRANGRFTFEEATAEAIRQESTYAYLDSRDSKARKGRIESKLPALDIIPAPPRNIERGEASSAYSRKPKQHFAAARGAPPMKPRPMPLAAVTPAPAGRHCYRCGDPAHLANACPHSDSQCRHCESKGLPGRGHTEEMCFHLHPELKNNRQGASAPRLPVGLVAPTFDGEAVASSNFDERVAAAVASALSQMHLQNNDFSFVGCALTAAAAVDPDHPQRPVRERVVPVRFRHPLPEAADHNRAGRPNVSRLPLGHERRQQLIETEDAARPGSAGTDILTFMDTAQVALERARRRVVILHSQNPSSVAPAVVAATDIDLLTDAEFEQQLDKHQADAELYRHFGIDPPGSFKVPAARIIYTKITPSQGQPLLRYEERCLIDPQVPYLNNFRSCLTLNGKTPLAVMVDTGAKPILLGASFAAQLGLTESKLVPAPYRIISATETLESVLGMSSDPIEFVFSNGSAADVTSIWSHVLVSKARDYDVLLGQDIIFPIGGIVDGWQGQFIYHPEYLSDGVRTASIPLLRPRFQSTAAPKVHAATPLKSNHIHEGAELLMQLQLTSSSFSTTPVSNIIQRGQSSWDFDDLPVSPDSDDDEEEASASVPCYAVGSHLQHARQVHNTLALRAAELYAQATASVQHCPQVADVLPHLSRVPAVLPTHLNNATVRPINRSVNGMQPDPGGYVILDLFSGISTQLHACLKNGMRIKAYYTVESDAVARTVASHHIFLLHQNFPHLLPKSAIVGSQSTLPNDIKVLSSTHLRYLPPVDLVFAGWECQGHSSAGKGLGLSDRRSSLFFDLVRIINCLEDIQLQTPNLGGHPFCYIFENVASQFDRRRHIRQDFQHIQHYLGKPVTLDAARHGSYAHRLRAIWTNLVDIQVLHAANQLVTRDLHLIVDDILDPYHKAQICTRPDYPPFYPANEVGRNISALPTLVSFPGSYAFRNGGPGMVYNNVTSKLEEPNADERERAMGFPTGTTAAPNIPEGQRRRLLGQAIDLRCLTFLLSLGLACIQACSLSSPPAPSQLGGGHKTAFDHQTADSDLVVSHAAASGSEADPHQAVEALPPDLHSVPQPPSWKFGSQLTDNEREQLADVLAAHADCFAYSMHDLGRHTTYRMRIELLDEAPIFKPKHRLSAYEWDLVHKRCLELEAAGLIRRSESTFAAPTVMPAKKDSDGNYTEKRMCGDYRALNDRTAQDRHPMPLADDIFDQMSGFRIYSILDLRQGFNQIEVEPSDCHKTAFWGSNCRWEWIVMPFGLKNAPAVFQKVMDSVLGDVKFARCYIDDVIVASNSIAEHCQHLVWLLTTLKANGLKCHPAKCLFGSEQVPYLGHMVSVHGTSPQQVKVEAILQIPSPADITSLRSFLGLVNYYRRFVPQFSTIAKPLNTLLQKGQQYLWGPEQQAAFVQLQQALTTYPVLRPPDYTLPFILQTDWGQPGIGAVLSQQPKQSGDYVVAYASRSNNRAESNYSSYEGECLAAVWAITHFRHYLYGRHFTLVTDHQPLHWLMTSDKLTGKLARWALILQEFDFTIQYRPGTSNANADTLSRNPLATTEDSTTRQDFDAQPVRTVYCAATLLRLVRDQFVGHISDFLTATLITRSRPVDVWLDTPVLRYLQEGSISAGLSPAERDRVQKRSQSYRWKASTVMRVFPTGTFRLVPRIEERGPLTARVHENMGHFGTRRTLSLMTPEYWWAGMYSDVAAFVQACAICDRVKASFLAKAPVLHPLPIRGMFYRWSCDLAGPLPTSKGAHNRFIMVMIEHFSKWIELVALQQKTARCTAAAFQDSVLARYGAPAECLTDQGTEFRGEFQALLDEALVDHRRTSREHPQADGLAERMVQTVKQALRKYCLEHDNTTWDEQLPNIAMGYRMSKQASLSNYSPYFLLYGREPALGMNVQAKCSQPVNLDDPDIWLQVVTERAQIFAREMPMAMRNLQIAQHRDQLRYATTRGGSYRPRQRKFEVGDYVYVRRQQQTTLDTGTSPHILRVKVIRENGILELQGADAQVTKEHMKNCAPCFLPDMDGSMDPMRARITDATPCIICNQADGEDTMLLCDRCNSGYHMECLTPPLTVVPAGEWLCAPCAHTASPTAAGSSSP